MAQQSARRDRDNQAATPYFEYATLIWTRSANSHAGRRSMAAQRPDRWQHPTTRHGIPDVFPCPEGGVHRCCTDRRCGRTEPDPCSGSCEADVLRASQLQHSVQHIGRDRHLARLSPVRLRPQPIADDTLPARLEHTPLTTTAIYANAVGEEEQSIAARMWRVLPPCGEFS